MRAGLALILAGVALGCSRPLPPPAPVAAHAPPDGPPPRDLGPVIALGHTEDRVCYCTTPVKPDGDLDYGLRFRVSGDVRAIIVYGSDAAGVPHGGEVWDTMMAPDVFPEAWHLPVPAKDSWAIAVIDSNNRLLNPNTVLEKTTFDNEWLTVFSADPGHSHFTSGRSFTVIVVRKDGRADRATTTVL